MVGNTYYLELMSILLNIFWPYKLMNKFMKVENLFLKRKEKRYQKRNLVVSDVERGYDTDYEVSKVKMFFSNFKDKKIKEKDKK